MRVSASADVESEGELSTSQQPHAHRSSLEVWPIACAAG